MPRQSNRGRVAALHEIPDPPPNLATSETGPDPGPFPASTKSCRHSLRSLLVHLQATRFADLLAFIDFSSGNFRIFFNFLPHRLALRRFSASTTLRGFCLSIGAAPTKSASNNRMAAFVN